MLSRLRLSFTGINATGHNCKLIRNQNQLITKTCPTAPDRGSGVDSISDVTFSILAFKSINWYWQCNSINHPHRKRNRTITFSLTGLANQLKENFTRTSPSSQDQPFAFTTRYSQPNNYLQFSMISLLSQILTRAKTTTCNLIRRSLFVIRYSLCKLSSQLFISYSVIR